MNRWNVIKAALIGAALGIVYAVAKALIDHPVTPPEYLAGAAVGGAIGGALLFSVVALIRNLAVRPGR